MKTILIIFIFIISTKNSQFHQYKNHKSINIFKKNSPKIRETFEIKNVRDLFACGSESCTIVREFSLNQNNTFSCYELNVGIEFKVNEINVIPVKQITMFGYLTVGFRARVLDTQKITKACPRIKKYNLYSVD